MTDEIRFTKCPVCGGNCSFWRPKQPDNEQPEIAAYPEYKSGEALKPLTFQFGTGKKPAPVPKDAVIVAPDSLIQPKGNDAE